MESAPRYPPAVVALAAALALLASGCSGSGPSTASTPSGQSVRLLAPSAFAAEVDGGQRFVLNVHTPDEGSIPGTDASIPFDRLSERATELPADRATPLAVYCRTGSMSRTAVASLARMGYTDIVELDGGMRAWTADGRSLAGATASQPKVFD